MEVPILMLKEETGFVPTGKWIKSLVPIMVDNFSSCSPMAI